MMSKFKERFIENAVRWEEYPFIDKVGYAVFCGTIATPVLYVTGKLLEASGDHLNVSLLNDVEIGMAIGVVAAFGEEIKYRHLKSNGYLDKERPDYQTVSDLSHS